MAANGCRICPLDRWSTEDVAATVLHDLPLWSPTRSVALRSARTCWGASLWMGQTRELRGAIRRETGSRARFRS